jgi:exodeoxyribonuclease VII large subunit
MSQELTHIYTVSDLTREIRDRLETHFSLVWVSGEVSNLRQPLSGHFYFTLKDTGAQLRAVLFKGSHQHLRCKPQEGGHFLCRGRLTVYEPRGEYQLVVDYLEPLGLGALAQAFEALKARLAAEGLFAAALKKPLPFLPRKIALVTSPTGAAVRDFLRLVKQRCPNLEILIYPVKVQGAEAAGEISRALDELAAYPGVEVIVLARGGGSLEDLWSFNEETVARAIHRCRVPVVSAVGHEVDFTIADFAADVRAPTPSAAAELVAPDQAELKRRLDREAAGLARALRRRLAASRQHLGLLARGLPDMPRRLLDLRFKVDERAEILKRRLERHLRGQRQQVRLKSSRLTLLSPRRHLAPFRQHLAQMGQRLFCGWQQTIEVRRRHLNYCESHLTQLNPEAILERGYAVATLLPEETVIREAAAVPLGAAVRVRVARGRLDCEVEKVSREK